MGTNPYIFDGKPTPFVYPPTSLLIFSMFAGFDFNFASELWTVAYFSLFAAALGALALTLQGDRRNLFVTMAILLSLTSYPLFIHFELGQSDLLVSSLAILSLVCERLKRRFASAAVLSVATLLKGPPILLLVYFVVFRRDVRYFVEFLVSILVIVGASLVVVPIGLYSYYAIHVTPVLSRAIGMEANQSVVGALALGGMSKLTPLLSLVAVGVFALFAFYAGSGRSAGSLGKNTLRSEGMFLMSVLMMLLFGPRSTVYPYVWVILPLALFLSSLLLESVKMHYLMLVGCATFLVNSVLSPNFLDYRTLPLALIGNVVLTISLIPIYVRPATIIQKIR
jgi:hypothetical protein